MKTSESNFTIDFSSFSKGLNTRDPHEAIGASQAYSGSQNARFSKKGFSPWFGFQGISEAKTFTGKCNGIDIYSRVSGTDILIGYSAGKVYSIDTSTNATTELYDITGSGECFGISMYDKFFVANGTGSCVIEGNTGYRIGLSCPVAVSAIASAGGSLPDGDYQLYASYARRVSDVNVQYSTGQSLGTITLGGGNNSIAISGFANSSDARVGNKVIFCTDADQEVIYLYHQTLNNTTTSFTISSDANKNESILYRIVSETSKLPPVMTGIFSHDDRIFGWKDNVLYASKQAVTVYDLECWPEIQYEFPYRIIGIFAVGPDLFLSTVRGIIKLPGADMSASYEHITKRMWFKYVRTVDSVDENSEENPSPVIGVTNDGVRIFDGIRFSRDISIDIKDRISDMYDGEDSSYQPCGIVYRSFDRTEYRLSFRDIDIGMLYNNVQYVLSIDDLVISTDDTFSAPWECVTTGFQYACIDSSNTLFMAQSLSSSSQVIKQLDSSASDKWIYDGIDYIVNDTAKNVVVVSKIEIPDIAGRISIEQLRCMSSIRSSTSAKITIHIGDNVSLSEECQITEDSSGGAKWDEAYWDIDFWVSNSPKITIWPCGEDIKGVAVYVTYSGMCDDILDYVLEIKLYGKYIQGMYA